MARTVNQTATDFFKKAGFYEALQQVREDLAERILDASMEVMQRVGSLREESAKEVQKIREIQAGALRDLQEAWEEF